MTFNEIFSRIRGDRRVLGGLGVIVAVLVAVVVARGDDTESFDLCDLTTLQSGPLLADDESDITLIVERLSQRADRIEGASEGQTPEVSTALNKIAASIREVADLVVTNEGSSGLGEAIERLSSDAELMAANDVVSKAVGEQCVAPAETTEPETTATTNG